MIPSKETVLNLLRPPQCGVVAVRCSAGMIYICSKQNGVSYIDDTGRVVPKKLLEFSEMEVLTAFDLLQESTLILFLYLT